MIGVEDRVSVLSKEQPNYSDRDGVNASPAASCRPVRTAEQFVSASTHAARLFRAHCRRNGIGGRRVNAPGVELFPAIRLVVPSDAFTCAARNSPGADFASAGGRSH